jgi:hypothetical protein
MDGQASITGHILRRFAVGSGALSRRSTQEQGNGYAQYWGLLVLMGVGSSVLHFLGMEFKLLMWIEN